MRRDPNLRMEAFPLETVERWLQAVIVHPGTLSEALSSDEAAGEIGPGDLAGLVKPSRSLTPEERVDIYHEMYLLRMEEALASDYPALKHFLGGEGFWELVGAYVRRHPSRSYTLNRLGDHLPEFLAEEYERPDAGFLADLARAERAVSQAFDEEESAVLGAEALQSVPAETWSDARLKPVAAFRLLELAHPVLDHLEAYKHDRAPQRPRRKAAWLAVWRRDFTVYRMDLSRAEFDLLASLAGGVPLGEAVAVAASALKSSRGQRRIFKWFRSWVAEGMFSAVSPG